MSAIDASVLIATHHRPDDLAVTLESLIQVRWPAAIAHEVIVVDNGTEPDTAAVCSAFQPRIQALRRIHVPEPGKSGALDRGIVECRGALILCTDDDVDCDPDWAQAILRSAAAHPNTPFFGGPVRGADESRMPAWMRENLDWLRCHPRVDRGPHPILLDNPDDLFLIGANFAFRRKLALQCRHNPRFGPVGSDRRRVGGVGGEERDFQRQLLALGGPGRYVPDAVIYHRDPPHRFTERFVRQWYYRSGYTEARHGLEPPCHPFLFGAPRHLWRSFVEETLVYLALRGLPRQSRRWLRAEARAAAALGQIRGFRHRTAQSTAPN